MRVLKQIHIGVALPLLAGLANSAQAGRLTKVWEFKTGNLWPRNSADRTTPSVFVLSFSADGRRIAAVLGRSWNEEFVALLDVADPSKSRVIEV